MMRIRILTGLHLMSNCFWRVTWPGNKKVGLFIARNGKPKWRFDGCFWRRAFVARISRKIRIKSYCCLTFHLMDSCFPKWSISNSLRCGGLKVVFRIVNNLSNGPEGYQSGVKLEFPESRKSLRLRSQKFVAIPESKIDYDSGVKNWLQFRSQKLITIPESKKLK